MKNKKQIVARLFLVMLSLFIIASIANGYNINTKKQLVTKEIEKTMLAVQEMSYRERVSTHENIDLIKESIEQEAKDSIKEKYKLDLQDVKSEVIKENGKTFIEIQGDIKNKFLILNKTNFKVRSEPQLFYVES